MLVSFFVKLKQARATGEDERQTEKMPVSDWTVGMAVGHFLHYWLMGKKCLSIPVSSMSPWPLLEFLP